MFEGLCDQQTVLKRDYGTSVDVEDNGEACKNERGAGN